MYLRLNFSLTTEYFLLLVKEDKYSYINTLLP